MKRKIKLLTYMSFYVWLTVFSWTLCAASFIKAFESGYPRVLVMMVGTILSSMIIYLWIGYSWKMKRVFKLFLRSF